LDLIRGSKQGWNLIWGNYGTELFAVILIPIGMFFNVFLSSPLLGTDLDSSSHVEWGWKREKEEKG